MNWPTWVAIIFVAIQAALVATAVIRHDTGLGMLAGLVMPFMLLSIGFAVISWRWPGRKRP